MYLDESKNKKTQNPNCHILFIRWYKNGLLKDILITIYMIVDIKYIDSNIFILKKLL